VTTPFDRTSETLDPFAVLDVARRFDIDLSEVRRAYLERSAMLHPDVAGEGPEVEEDSARLNAAKQALEDPEQRAICLWRLLGGGSLKSGTDDRALPPGFLMEMMEVREKMEAELASGEQAKREEWEEWGRQRRAAHEATVAGLFADAAPDDAGALKSIKLELNAWRYIERMMEQLAEQAR
jgi:curved DNA-binding protein CbpA